jgi:transcriptional regulator with XRE-family HTH domain
MIIGTKIRQLRDERKLSQRDVAAGIGMTQPNYHKLESDDVKAKMETVEKLSAFFGVSVDEIRGIEKTGVHIEKNENNTNQKISGFMINLSDEDIIEQLKETIGLLKKQMSDKDMIVGLQAEKIKMLELRLAEVVKGF